jgi:hypothetical protein
MIPWTSKALSSSYFTLDAPQVTVPNDYNPVLPSSFQMIFLRYFPTSWFPVDFAGLHLAITTITITTPILSSKQLFRTIQVVKPTISHSLSQTTTKKKWHYRPSYRRLQNSYQATIQMALKFTRRWNWLLIQTEPPWAAFADRLHVIRVQF